MEERSSQFNWKSEHNNEWDCIRAGGQWVSMSNFFDIDEKSRSEQQCNQYQTANPDIRTRWAIPYRSSGIQYINTNLGDTAKACLILPPKVKCKVAPTSRPNHLGNGENVIALRHQWILPYTPTGRTLRCVYRIRYAYIRQSGQL